MFRRHNRSEDQPQSSYGHSNVFPSRLAFDSPGMLSRFDDNLLNGTGDSGLFENPYFSDASEYDPRGNTTAAQSRSALIFALRQSDEKIRNLKKSLSKYQAQASSCRS